MKQLVVRSILAVALVACLVAAGTISRSAAAQAAPALVVGVVDWDAIMRESKAAKSIKQQLDAQKATYQAELREQEDALKDADQKLAAQRSSLSEADFKNRLQELNQQAEKLRQTFKQRQEQLDDNLRAGLEQIRGALLQIVADIAQQRKLTLVLNKADVVLAHSEYDFTKEAMQKLDAKLPSIKLRK